MYLRNFIESIARLEDNGRLFSPEYLRIWPDEEAEIAEMCERRECEKCTTPDGYCGEVMSDLLWKSAVYSAANRILDALKTRGSYVLSWLKDRESEKYAPEFWDSEYGLEFCVKCRKYMTAECPEDVYSAECERRATVAAVGKVLSAVDDLI